MVSSMGCTRARNGDGWSSGVTVVVPSDRKPTEPSEGWFAYFKHI